MSFTFLMLAWLPFWAITATPSRAPRAAEMPAGSTPVLQLADGGVGIDAGSMGKFVLQYPALGLDGQKTRAPIEKRVSGSQASLKYEGGGSIDLSLGAGGAIAMSVDSLPPDVKTIRMEMRIDFNFTQGGAWSVGDGELRPFPATRPAGPNLFQGHAGRLTLRNSEGRSLVIEYPPSSYTQLQDNRQWGWKMFDWWFAIPYDRTVRDYRVTVAAGGVVAPQVLVDRFGQSASAYPGKVTSVAQLKADVATEKRWLASLHPPRTDRYGGLPESGSRLGLKRTGFFHVEQTAGKWFLVDPEGNAFFQLGICAMGPSDDYTTVAGRTRIYQQLPAPVGAFRSAYRPGDLSAFSFHLANRISKTGRSFDLDDYLSTMIGRARKWGFNSAGAFSPTFRPAERRANWPYVAHLPLALSDGIPQIPGIAGVWDPFDETNRRKVEKLFAERVTPHAGDSLLIGYFLSNEPIYQDLPRVLPTLNGQFACKRRLVQSLQDEYRAIEGFNVAWSAHAQSFDELNDRGLAVSTQAAREDVRRFVGQFLDETYRFVTETFRRNDANHLLLGSRFQPGTIDDEQLCRICGKYMDVVSFNYYTYGIDRDLLNRVYGWTGNKPMLLSEFNYCSPSDSHLPGGGMEVDSQEQRGLAYRNYVEQSTALGFVVGIEWFTLVDQSITGRYFEKYNGENANTGLISVADRPWKSMLGHMIVTNYRIYDVLLGRQAPFVFDDPRFRAGGSAK